jgi:hypothetical protein
MAPDEMLALATGLAELTIAVDMVDWSPYSDREREDVLALGLYILRQRVRAEPQRRALRLFRSWLSACERAELRVRRHVTVTGSLGGRYRIMPATGVTLRIERHGQRWFGRSSFCLHPDEWVPPADVALGHYLCLRTDEAAFLRSANEHRSDLWDGAYIRRLRAARDRRQQQECAA